jgi:hypothetical protein
MARAFLVAASLIAGLGCSPSVEEYASSDEQSDDAEDTTTGDGDTSTSTTSTTGDTTTGGSDDTTDGGDTGSKDTGDTDTGPCPPGDLGCPCDGGLCKGDYLCMDGVCESEAYPWGKCGWDPDNEWYWCGFMGEDPSGTFPIDCGDLPLVDGSPCPRGLTFEGCCDTFGNTWYCNGETDKTVRKPCG